MNFLRKTYNIESADGSGGEQVSVAEMMAKAGYNSDNRPEPKAPVEDTGQNEQVETKDEAQAATASAETKVETVVQEAEKPAEQVQAAEQKTEAPPATISWQEVLKQQQPDTVLKELGFDDSKIGLIQKMKTLDPKMVAFLDVWESNGDVTAYLREMTTDYSKMSSEDVMRNQLRNEYPEASDKAIEALFKRKVVDTYSLDTDKYSEDEVEEGRLLLDAEADKYRKVLVQQQQEKILPRPPEAKAEAPDNSEQEATARFEDYKATVSNNPYTQGIFTSKQFSIGEGEEKFNFPVNPASITDTLFNSEKWRDAMFEVTANAKGELVYNPKVEHQMLVSLVATYGKDFLNEYAKHFKAIGGRQVIDPIDNAKPIELSKSSASETRPASAAEAMAKGGRLV